MFSSFFFVFFSLWWDHFRCNGPKTLCCKRPTAIESIFLMTNDQQVLAPTRFKTISRKPSYLWIPRSVAVKAFLKDKIDNLIKRAIITDFHQRICNACLIKLSWKQKHLLQVFPRWLCSIILRLFYWVDDTSYFYLSNNEYFIFGCNLFCS
jgi:hypothetical protein